MYITVYDEIGNHPSYEVDAVPRIGERLHLTFSRGGGPLKTHMYRVVDVEYRLDNSLGSQVAILTKEEINPEQWPS